MLYNIPVTQQSPNDLFTSKLFVSELFAYKLFVYELIIRTSVLYVNPFIFFSHFICPL